MFALAINLLILEPLIKSNSLPQFLPEESFVPIQHHLAMDITFTIEVTQVQVFVSVICALLLVIVWLFLSKRKLSKAVTLLRQSHVPEKIQEISVDHEVHEAVEESSNKKKPEASADSDTSEDSQDDEFYTLQLQQPRRKFVMEKQQPIVASNPSVSVKTLKQVEQLLQASTCISRGSPSMYKLPVKLKRTVKQGIEKEEVGTPHPLSKPTRVFMVVGATGAGKSTLINGMVNYLMGVKFEDHYRFKLITDEAAKSQAHSQTQKITSYTIYWHEESPVDYNLIIVDTPGFGDTRGMDRDNQIKGQINDFFSLKGDAGIDQIHGIGFVIQSTLVRLTATQKYVFESVLSVFGNDIKNNIFIMSTFADGSEPAVKVAIREAQIPCFELLLFNSERLFANNTDQFSKMFWNMAYKSFQEFFARFSRTETVSLQLSREVLKERQQLECTVTGLQQRIKDGIAKIDELHQEEQVLKEHEADIQKNKNFTYKVKIAKQRKIDISGQGKYVTNCQQCNFTCHKPCSFSNDSDKFKCVAMDRGGITAARCQICPGNCHWKMHNNNSYYYETYEEEETRMSSELKNKHHDANLKKAGTQGMILKIKQEVQDLHNKLLLDIQKVRQCLERLSRIALKPNPLTDVEYIGLLIQAEQIEGKPGFMRRITYLNELKDKAKCMGKVGSQSSATAQWKSSHFMK